MQLDCEFGKRIVGTEELEESLAAVPLRHGGAVTGAIVISKLGINQFDEDDVRLLEVLAGQASVALENALLYERQRREAENAKALLSFADAASRAQSFDDICRLTVVTAASLFVTDRVSLWLDESCAASIGMPLSDGVEAVLVEGDGVRGRLVLDLDGDGEEVEQLLAELRLAGVGRAAEGAPLLAPARVCRDRERTARGEPRARDGGVARTRCSRGRVEVTARSLGTAVARLWIQDEGPSGDVVCLAAYGQEKSSHRFSAELAQEWLIRKDPFVLERADFAEIVGVSPDEALRFVVAPLHLDAGRLGALTALIDDRQLDDRQMRLFAGLAHQAKLAIESAAHYDELEETFVSTIAALANALEANDQYTSSHARWITDMALLVGRELDSRPGGTQATRARCALPRHREDRRAVGDPAEGRPADRRGVRGREGRIRSSARRSSLRFTGLPTSGRSCARATSAGTGSATRTGRPARGIPLESRIVLVCDAFHAMATDRPYRTRLSADEAVRRLREGSGSQFDPRWSTPSSVCTTPAQCFRSRPPRRRGPGGDGSRRPPESRRGAGSGTTSPVVRA